ncbi:MAG: hypothetical protein P0Y64_10550 [Candidatus Sphingomonas colombiensis]|nr:hypothetical protein [Sphingomonas sp.]WEK41848.1 MAG: hypothetical protein P0Y64_10550 [Sphingomonas sp.]
MTLTLNELFSSPDHYLHSFDAGDAIFVPMDRAAYQRSIFLDNRISPADDGSMRLPLAAITRDIPPPQSTSWIFHIAHCGSTLLARALDFLGGNLVLREPLALRQLALAPDPTRLALTTAMLGKRYRPESATLIKANVPVNFLLPALAQHSVAPMRAIMLFATLEDYLLAILRSDNHRDWVKRITSQLDAHLGNLGELSVAERAAALWHGQMKAFESALAASPNARTLDAESFFNDPLPTLTAGARHLEIDATTETLREVVSGPLFSSYSKQPSVPFDNEARLARRDALVATLAPEIAAARAWVEQATQRDAHVPAAIIDAQLRI